MEHEDTGGLLEVARECALAAGAILSKAARAGFSVSAKSAHHDLVTSADIEAEQEIARMIRDAFPEHDIVGEEGKYPVRGSRFVWHIDPVDGTVNFAKGLPFFSVSVGVCRDGVPEVGVVHDPSRSETFWAARGGGAYLDGERLCVAPSAGLREALLATGFHYDRGERMLQTLELIRRFLEAGAVEIRRIGSAALELAYVAAGRLDGFWEHRLQSWDVAAGILLVREAGGRVTDEQGREREVKPGYTVASNGLLHPRILEVLRSVPQP